MLAPGSDPVELARGFSALGLCRAYLADLDALGGEPPALGLVEALAAVLPDGVWVDAGACDAKAARRLLDAGAARAVIGLETLPGRDALAALAAEVDPDRLTFSLDLRGERTVTAAPELAGASPEAALGAALETGLRVAIVLDLERVGSGAGPPVALLRRLRERFPEARLLAGGGVRDVGDLRTLAAAGCAGALVATALHEGRIGRTELEGLAG